jgi:hypothetical protein
MGKRTCLTPNSGSFIRVLWRVAYDPKKLKFVEHALIVKERPLVSMGGALDLEEEAEALEAELDNAGTD